MRFRDVVVAGMAHVLPDEVVTSTELESRLLPLYSRLGLRVGRLELMTGIRERRFFAKGTLPSSIASRAGEVALRESALARERIGLIVHASVCRDGLEPSTASVVHRALELPATAVAFDLSNACLGFANALTLAAAQIESGTLSAAVIVAAEDGRALVDATVEALLARGTKQDLKRAFASLTIGAGGAAWVLAHRSLAPDSPRFTSSTALADTHSVDLCHGERVDGASGPLMETDSEALLHAGNALAARTFEVYLEELGWKREDIQRVVTHQVGVAHRRLLLSTLGLAWEIDFPTVERLGNMGSVSLPLSFHQALDQGFITRGQRVALLGIGSGLHCMMLSIET
ncbi:MAG TPA: 3-oxoacyl-ACP synthase III [Planctomycetota bacterium]|nr:3-oxoacyl-ACP synthase III [Planctomycetota bacterium]